jgi:hypothetical protein
LIAKVNSMNPAVTWKKVAGIGLILSLAIIFFFFIPRFPTPTTGPDFLLSIIPTPVSTPTATPNQNPFTKLTSIISHPSVDAVSVSPDLALYSDNACTVPLSFIDWGPLSPGQNITQAIYIKNTSSDISFTLKITTNNWTPINANGPITVTWDQEGNKLRPQQSTAAVLTLAISPTIVDILSFNVQIAIIGID